MGRFFSGAASGGRDRASEKDTENQGIWGPMRRFAMNLSKTVDTISELRSSGGASDELVAEHLRSILEASGAHVHSQTIYGHSQTALFVVALALSIVFLAALLKGRRRIAFVSALAIPLFLCLELSTGFGPVSRLAGGTSENIFATFPVQDAAREVIVGTSYARSAENSPDRFAETVAAFLFPVTLVMTILGLWRFAAFFGKFDSEDARTIALIMGATCAAYYALALGMSANGALSAKKAVDPAHNAGSVAVLAALAEDLSEKYPRLETTSVTIAFFGHGRAGATGSENFAEKLARETDRALPVYFVGLDGAGNGGNHAYTPGEGSGSFRGGSDLNEIFGRAAADTLGRPLEIVRDGRASSEVFAERGYPAIVLSTLPPDYYEGGEGGGNSGDLDRGQLLLTLQLIEAGLAGLDKRALDLP
jgi:hypothetical protein